MIDNAANQVLGVKLSGYELFRCCAHTIQLAIKDAFSECPNIQKMIAKCQKIVKFFKKSGPAMRKLTTAQQLLRLPELKLLQNVKTRWNSEFYMVYRVFELKEPLLLAMAQIPEIEPLTPEEWLMCDELIDLLAPIEAATKTLCGRKYATISMIVPVIRGVVEHLSTIIFKCPNVLRIRAYLVKNINERFEKHEANKFVMTSTLLDPRFKKGESLISFY